MAHARQYIAAVLSSGRKGVLDFRVSNFRSPSASASAGSVVHESALAFEEKGNFPSKTWHYCFVVERASAWYIPNHVIPTVCLKMADLSLPYYSQHQPDQSPSIFWLCFVQALLSSHFLWKTNFPPFVSHCWDMRGPLNINLAEFGVSPRNGFLPDQLPLQVLIDQNWACWENIIRQLPSLLKSRTFKTRVDKLPIPSTSNFRSEQEWQRAYLILSFMTHAYIWEAGGPSEVCIETWTLCFN